MKNIFTIIFILIFAAQSHSQSYEWAYTTGYSNYHFLSSIKRDHAGDVYLASYKDSSGHILNTRIEKRNSANAVLWNIDFPDTALIVDVEINSQNHPVFAGYFAGELIIGTDTLRSPSLVSAFLIETFENGNFFWAVSFNPANDDFMPTDIFIDRSDNIYMAAELAGGSSHGFCSFHKLDVWGVPMQDEFNDDTEIRTFSHIMADDSGNVYLSGTCGNFAHFDTIAADPAFSYENFLVKYDAAFKAQWLITRSYITFDHNNGLGSDGQSLYWSFLEATQVSDSIKLVKTDFNGQIQIDKTGPLTHTFFPSISSGTDSSGNTVLASNIFNKIYLFRYDNQFNLQWEDSILAQISGFTPHIQLACYDSTFYIGSRFYNDSVYIDSILLINSNAPTFGSEIFFAKWGYENIVSVSNLKKNSSINFYPNPANNRIHFFYPENRKAVVTITDCLGRNCLVQSIENSGIHEVNIEGIKPGLYFLRISGNDFSIENRLVICE